MSAVVGIIFFYIIFYTIKKSMKENSNSTSLSSAQRNSSPYLQSGTDYAKNIGSQSSKPVTIASSNSAYQNGNMGAGARNTSTMSSAQKTSTQVKNVNGGVRTGNATSAPKQNAMSQQATSTSQAAKQNVKEKSTMEYLQEKANADQAEHAKEKYEEQRRVNASHGNRPTGGRYLLGDPVPRGSKLFVCSYCGAENIVPLAYYGDKDCYFCRTHLK